MLETHALETEGIDIDHDEDYTTYTSERHELTATHLLCAPHQLLLNSETDDGTPALIKFDGIKWNPSRGRHGDTTISFRRDGQTCLTLKSKNISTGFSLLLTQFD